MGGWSNFTVSMLGCDESNPALPPLLGLRDPPCSTVALDSDVTMKMAVTQGTGTQTLLICSSNALRGNRKPQEGHKRQLCIDWQTFTSFRKAQLKWPCYQRGKETIDA